MHTNSSDTRVTITGLSPYTVYAFVVQVRQSSSVITYQSSASHPLSVSAVDHSEGASRLFLLIYISFLGEL